MGSGTPYFIPLEEAVEITLKRRLSLDSEEISIDKAFHRTLSEPLSALTAAVVSSVCLVASSALAALNIV